MAVVLTHDPLQGAHFQEAERAALMFAGLGHRVDFVLMDGAVRSLLERSGYGFGLKTLARLSGIEGLTASVLGSSMERVEWRADEHGLNVLTDGEFAEMLMDAKAVVF